MKQLSLFEFPETLIKPVLNNEFNNLLIKNKEGVILEGNPRIPGIYPAMTYISPNFVKKNKFFEDNFRKFWNGYAWYYLDGGQTDSQHKVAWLDELIPQQREEATKNVNGWESKPPLYQGVYWATNNSERKEKKYIRTWNGNNWSNRLRDGLEGSRDVMFWHADPVSLEDLETTYNN